MTGAPLITALVWTLGAVGVALLVTKPPPGAQSSLWLEAVVRLRVAGRRVRGPVLVALAATLISGWPATGLLAGLVAWSLPALVADTKKGRERRLERREAVAKWLEMLADGFASGGFLQSTILATDESPPPAIEAEVRRLCSRLRGGHGDDSIGRPWDFERALAAFAEEFAQRDVDRAVVALVLASHGQASDLSRVVRKAAARLREAVAVDRRIESGPRAWIYMEVRFTEALMGVLGLAVLLRVPLLRPLGGTGGQLYLGVVGVVALLLLRSLANLARPRQESRPLVIIGQESS